MINPNIRTAGHFLKFYYQFGQYLPEFRQVKTEGGFCQLLQNCRQYTSVVELSLLKHILNNYIFTLFQISSLDKHQSNSQIGTCMVSLQLFFQLKCRIKCFRIEMSSIIDFMSQMVILVLLIRVDLMETQILGSILREPLNNLIKFFDGSYGSTNDADNNRIQGNSLKFQPRFAIDNSDTHSGGNCAGIWSYTNDFRGNSIGLVTARNPDPSKNVLKLTMSLSAALPSVNLQIQFCMKTHWIFPRKRPSTSHFS